MVEIPNILFTYWAGAELTYLHVLSLRAVQFFHPNSKIIVYTDSSGISVAKSESHNLTEHSVKIQQVFDFRTQLAKFDGLDLVELDMASILNTDKAVFHAFCADFIRVYKLWEHGGIWFDLDLLFTKNVFNVLPRTLDMGKSVCVAEVRKDADCTIGTGFAAATPKSPFLEKILHAIRDYLRESANPLSHTTGYQTLGPDVWKNFAEPYCSADLMHMHPHIQCLPLNAYAPYLWFEVSEYFTGKSSSKTLSPLTFGNHWYFGSNYTRQYLNSMASSNDFDRSPPIGQDIAYLENLGLDVRSPDSEDRGSLDLNAPLVFGNSKTHAIEVLTLAEGVYEVYVLASVSESLSRFSIQSSDNINIVSIDLPRQHQEIKHSFVLDKTTRMRFEVGGTVERVVFRKRSIPQDAPRILTIVPLRDCERYIERCVRSLMNQTVKPSLICVIDDNSTDSSLNVLDSIDCGIPMVVWRHHESFGPYVCKNLAISEFKECFEFVTYLDSDDYLLHENYEMLLNLMRANQEKLGVYPHLRRMRNNLEVEHPPHPRTKLRTRISFAGFFARSQLFDKVGYYDCVRFGGDGEFHSRIGNILGPAVLGEFTQPTYLAEVRDKSLTVESKASIDEKSLSPLRSAYAKCLDTTKEAKPPINIPLNAPREIRTFCKVSAIYRRGPEDKSIVDTGNLESTYGTNASHICVDIISSENTWLSDRTLASLVKIAVQDPYPKRVELTPSTRIGIYKVTF